jgi:rhodanese-related sulfurtransferase
MKMVFDKMSRELLGLQAVGEGDVKNPVDLFASLLMRQGELDDLFDIESAYSPPYANALDSLYVLGCIAQNQIDGFPEIVSPDVVLKGGPARGTTILDIREEDERKNEPLTIKSKDIIEIPFTQLREKLPEIELGEECLIVCARGLRGFEAATMIREAGKSNPKFLGGGWNFCRSVMKEDE